MVGINNKNKNSCTCGPRMERFIQPCLLLLLSEKAGHGYELLENLTDFGFEKDLDPGMVYRNLRKLEKENAVVSNWDTGRAGPARRIYQLTPRGHELIKEWNSHIEQKIMRLEYFSKRYSAKINRESDNLV